MPFFTEALTRVSIWKSLILIKLKVSQPLQIMKGKSTSLNPGNSLIQYLLVLPSLGSLILWITYQLWTIRRSLVLTCTIILSSPYSSSETTFSFAMIIDDSLSSQTSRSYSSSSIKKSAIRELHPILFIPS